MRLFLLQLLPGVIFIGTLYALLGILMIASRRRKRRRSPLTRQLLRGPGHSLVVRIEDVGEDIQESMAMITVLPLTLYASYISLVHFDGPTTSSVPVIYLIMGLGVFVWFGGRLPKSIKERP